MNRKHLRKGAEFPPLSKGKLRLYSMRFSPFAQHVQLVLDAKQIPYDIVNINLIHKPEWFTERTLMGKVPVLETESGDCICESLIIADFLDEEYPHRLLYPKDPVQKAKDRILMDLFNKVGKIMLKFFLSPTDENFEEFLTSLDVYEKELTLRSKPFFGGDRPGMLDYRMWPWFERGDVLQIMAGDQFYLPKDRFTRLINWRNIMIADEAVKISYIDPQNHAKFIKSLLDGRPYYNIMVKSVTSHL